MQVHAVKDSQLDRTLVLMLVCCGRQVVANQCLAADNMLPHRSIKLAVQRHCHGVIHCYAVAGRWWPTSAWQQT